MSVGKPLAGQQPPAGQQSDGAELGTVTWPDVDTTAGHRLGPLLLVPLGACEQHGPHLPFNTDTVIASAVAAEVMTVLGRMSENPDERGENTQGTTNLNSCSGDSGPASGEVFVAPAVEYGASGEHEAFPGTVSLGTEALYALVVEYGRSAGRWARRIVFVNGHGGNATAVVAAVRTLRSEGCDAAWLPCSDGLPAAVSTADVVPDMDAPDGEHRAPEPPGDSHAGFTETSLMLALSPETVRLDRAQPGNTQPTAQLMPRLRKKGVRAVSPLGVLGDPTAADAEVGRQILTAIVADTAQRISIWNINEAGMLNPSTR